MKGKLPSSDVFYITEGPAASAEGGAGERTEEKLVLKKVLQQKTHQNHQGWGRSKDKIN